MPNRPPLDDYSLRYRGDLRGRIEGQVVGPNRMREWFVILETEYDPKTNLTTARVGFATTEDMKRERPAGVSV